MRGQTGFFALFTIFKNVLMSLWLMNIPSWK